MNICKKNLKKTRKIWKERIKILEDSLSSEEHVCNKCNGFGDGNKRSVLIKENPLKMGEICGKCLGWGKIDWIENMIGKTNSGINLRYSFHVNPITRVATISEGQLSLYLEATFNNVEDR